MNFTHFNAQFKAPLLFKTEMLSYKKGVYIYEAKEPKILGEISPLPGFSQETFAQINPTLSDLKTAFLSTDMFFSYERFSPYPSVRFGLSMLANLKNNLKNILTEKAKIQGLLQGTPMEVLEKAHKLNSLGIKIAKLKVGRLSLEIEKELIFKILKETSLNLRLDANQKWKLSEAVLFLKNIPLERIDFLEEPLENPKELEFMYFKTQIPYALDENLNIFRNNKLKGLKALVIKPTLVGDCHDVRELVSDYTKNNSQKLEVIVSSSYETSVGIDYLKKLALQLNPDGYHGLDTLDLIEKVELSKE